MALQTINIGASANDGSGDPLRTAMDKINDNFEAIAAGEIRVTDLGNLGAAETIDNANGPYQRGTLDQAACDITLPAVAASATGWTFDLDLVQDSTGGRLVSFLAVSGDVVRWKDGQAPSINTLYTYPGAVNRFRFVAGLDGIRAEHLNPKDSGFVMTGGSFIQQAFRSLLGTSAVTKRIPMEEDCKEVSTTDATVTTILRVPVPMNSVRHVIVWVDCIQDDASEGGGGSLEVTFRRATGNVAEIDAETIIAFSEDSAGIPAISATVDTTNQDGLIQVTGVAATNLYWGCDYRISGLTL